jgi:hypothetical protein
MLFNRVTEMTAKVKPSPLKGLEASVCDLDHSPRTVNELPEPHSTKHGSYVMANVPKRRVVVVHPSVNEALIDEFTASGTVHGDGAKNGGETTQSRKPWPAEFGWDFPFDFPKPGR